MCCCGVKYVLCLYCVCCLRNSNYIVVTIICGWCSVQNKTIYRRDESSMRGAYNRTETKMNRCLGRTRYLQCNFICKVSSRVALHFKLLTECGVEQWGAGLFVLFGIHNFILFYLYVILGGYLLRVKFIGVCAKWMVKIAWQMRVCNERA